MGLQRDGTATCSVAYFGDGSASEGDFHEAANLAGVFGAPVVLFCQHNGWAISLPSAQQSAGEIWRRGDGLGFPGVLVDGNDVLAVYEVTRRARDRAATGDGPTLIEARTYRIGAHSTADDAGRYRDEAEVEAARALDPIERYRTWLIAAGHADEAFAGACVAEADEHVAAIREGVVAQPAPPAEWLFDWTYADPPATLARQRAEALGDG
jgi:2-oxoisovalerate dehydrogenase E1 component alpha subunit